MKRYLLLIAAVSLAAPVHGQSGSASAPAQAAPVQRAVPQRTSAEPQAHVPNPELPRFDLDFPGGTPRELVKAIEKASGKPLNAVIREEDARIRLAAISVKNVTVPQLFVALVHVSTEEEAVPESYSSMPGMPGGRSGTAYRVHSTRYGFATEGTPTENSIWYFFRNKPARVPEPTRPATCRFYQLGPYLEANYKVEDITTAIETAWKMLGDKEPPKMSYHKDTKILIAVGDPDKLEMINQVLRQLTPVGPQSPASPK